MWVNKKYCIPQKLLPAVVLPFVAVQPFLLLFQPALRITLKCQRLLQELTVYARSTGMSTERVIPHLDMPLTLELVVLFELGLVPGYLQSIFSAIHCTSALLHTGGNERRSC